jgi:hypothetical protein
MITTQISTGHATRRRRTRPPSMKFPLRPPTRPSWRKILREVRQWAPADAWWLCAAATWNTELRAYWAERDVYQINKARWEYVRCMNLHRFRAMISTPPTAPTATEGQNGDK